MLRTQTFPSKSRPDKPHVTTLWEDGHTTCTHCWPHYRDGECRHTRELLAAAVIPAGGTIQAQPEVAEARTQPGELPMTYAAEAAMWLGVD